MSYKAIHDYIRSCLSLTIFVMMSSWSSIEVTSVGDKCTARRTAHFITGEPHFHMYGNPSNTSPRFPCMWCWSEDTWLNTNGWLQNLIHEQRLWASWLINIPVVWELLYSLSYTDRSLPDLATWMLLHRLYIWCIWFARYGLDATGWLGKSIRVTDILQFAIWYVLDDMVGLDGHRVICGDWRWNVWSRYVIRHCPCWPIWYPVSAPVLAHFGSRRGALVAPSLPPSFPSHSPPLTTFRRSQLSSTSPITSCLPSGSPGHVSRGSTFVSTTCSFPSLPQRIPSFWPPSTMHQ